MAERRRQIDPAMSDRIERELGASALNIWSSLQSLLSLAPRAQAFVLREARNIDAHPVLFGPPPPAPAGSQRKAQVIHVVLSAMPQPTQETSWQQILEFRAEQKQVDAMSRLRTWIAKMARSDSDAAELAEELQALMATYRVATKAARMRTQEGVVGVLTRVADM